MSGTHEKQGFLQDVRGSPVEVMHRDTQNE